MSSYTVDRSRPLARSECRKGSVREGQWLNEHGEKETIRFVQVRDYKDRAILRILQIQARSESPGFVWYDGAKDRARLAWIRRGREGEAIGYCIFKEGRYEYSEHARREVYVPRYISQIFVVEGQRRRSIATTMISEFASGGGNGPLWIESPKSETIGLLHNLGYHESRDRYQLWEMMFGLTCWSRHGQIDDNIPPANNELAPATFYEPWLWSGDSAIGMASLR